MLGFIISVSLVVVELSEIRKLLIRETLLVKLCLVISRVVEG